MNTLDIFLIGLSVFFIVTTVVLALSYYRLKLRFVQLKTNDSDDSIIKEKFKSLAAQALEGNSRMFLDLAKSTLEKENQTARSDLDKRKLEINHLVEPLRKNIEDYQVHLREIEKERQRCYTTVESELRRVAELSSNLSSETTALKNALKKPHIRGRWGEIQLKNCIELAGMSEFADVKFQDSQMTDNEQRLIPDLTVKMPGGRVVIVDAKTPIDAFIGSLEATTDELRTSEMARHGRHVKEHIKKLSSKAYAENLKDSADFTVMFLPNESFLYAALESQPDIMEFALQRKVLIATPPTFIGMLKVIRFGWNEVRLAENASKIYEAGCELHKRVVDFVDCYTLVGKHLERAKQEYDTGLTRLESRIITQARRLEQLGAQSNKTLTTSSELVESH